jgi:2-keto-4-pentenoate hydratase
LTISKDAQQAITRGLMDALRANTLYAPPSAASAVDAPLSMADAMAIQRSFVELHATIDDVAGYKSAANAQALQTALGLSEPIVGALFARGERRMGDRIERTAYRTLLIETELGFRVARKIDASVASVAELRSAMSTCVPMIELADPGFGHTRFTGLDLIAANSASAGFICGKSHQADRLDVNALHVRLSRDGAILHEATSADLMGDQWQALLWLVNKVIDAGYTIKPGMLFMTGALGGAHQALPGEYLAEFGELGDLRFQVS